MTSRVPPNTDSTVADHRQTRARVVLVTGMSGAGRSSTLKVLEDLGYEAVDNLPLTLVGNLVRSDADAASEHPRRPLAVGVDIRTRDFGVDSLLGELDRLAADADFDLRILFLDCDDEVLIRRYTETRRRHPLDGERPVPDMIRLERRLLMRLRDRADAVIDTSMMTPWELKDRIGDRFALDTAPGLRLFITSFSYRHGVPREADLVLDVRFLQNPHYDPDLRPLTGDDPRVVEAVLSDADFAAFFERLTGMLDVLLPRYEREGKSYLTIAVGCTGGRHRSVVVAAQLAQWLARKGWDVKMHHRDIRRLAGKDMT